MARRTTPRSVNAAEKARLAINLRKQGYTLDEIAIQCGYQDKSGAHRAIKRELDNVVSDEVEDLRKIETMRLDALLKVCMEKALEGDMWAVDRALAISKRRSEVTGIDKRPDEMNVNQNYTKRIILTHQVSTGGEIDGNANS